MSLMRAYGSLQEGNHWKYSASYWFSVRTTRASLCMHFGQLQIWMFLGMFYPT